EEEVTDGVEPEFAQMGEPGGADARHITQGRLQFQIHGRGMLARGLAGRNPGLSGASDLPPAGGVRRNQNTKNGRLRAFRLRGNSYAICPKSLSTNLPPYAAGHQGRAQHDGRGPAVRHPLSGRIVRALAAWVAFALNDPAQFGAQRHVREISARETARIDAVD